MRGSDAFIAVMFTVMVVGGLGLVAFAVSLRFRLRELRVRERIAMIEKGLIPPPEIDPARFEVIAGLMRRQNSRGSRYRTAGIMAIGLGLGLMLLITFAASEPNVGIGIGGGFAVLGVAILVNGVLLSREGPIADESASRTATRVPPSEPPGNIAP